MTKVHFNLLLNAVGSLAAAVVLLASGKEHQRRTAAELAHAVSRALKEARELTK